MAYKIYKDYLKFQESVILHLLLFGFLNNVCVCVGVFLVQVRL